MSCGRRNDNGWEFCQACTNQESDTCDLCEEGDQFEPIDFAHSLRQERELFPEFQLALAA